MLKEIDPLRTNNQALPADETCQELTLNIHIQLPSLEKKNMVFQIKKYIGIGVAILFSVFRLLNE